GGAERGDGRGLEPGERGPEVLPLAQDGEPRQPGLERLKRQALEDPGIAAHRPPPLLIVVAAVLRGAQRPRAAQQPVRPGHGTGHYRGSHRARSSASSRRSVAISTSPPAPHPPITPRASSVADTL